MLTAKSFADRAMMMMSAFERQAHRLYGVPS